MFILYYIPEALMVILYILVYPFIALYKFLKKKRKEYDEMVLSKLGYYRTQQQDLCKLVDGVETAISKDEEKRIIRQIHGKSKYKRKEQIQIVRKLRKDGVLKTPFFERPNVKLFVNIMFVLFGFPVCVAIALSIAEGINTFKNYRTPIYYGDYDDSLYESIAAHDNEEYEDNTELGEDDTESEFENRNSYQDWLYYKQYGEKGTLQDFIDKTLPETIEKIIESSDKTRAIAQGVDDATTYLGASLFVMPFFLSIAYPVSIVLGLIICRILYGFDPDLEDDEKSVNTKALDIVIAKSIYNSHKELERRKNSKPKFDD